MFYNDKAEIDLYILLSDKNTYYQIMDDIVNYTNYEHRFSRKFGFGIFIVKVYSK